MRRPSLKLNAVSSWAALCANAGIGVFLTPFIIRHLGSAGYGIWVLVGSFVGYYGLLNLGVGSAVTRYIARYASREDWEGLSSVASTAMAMFCMTGVLVLAGSFLLAHSLALYFHISAGSSAAFEAVVRTMGAITALGFPTSVLLAAVSAHEHFVATNLANIGTAVIRATLTVTFLLLGWGLSGVMYAALAVQAVALVVALALTRRLTPRMRIRPHAANVQVLGRLMGYGGTTTVIAVADILRGDLGSVIVGKEVGLAAVGVFGIALSVTTFISGFVSAGMGVLTPRFAAMDGRGENGAARDLLLRSLSFSSFLAFGGCSAVVILGEALILRWVGPAFAGAIPAVTALAISSSFALAQNPAIGYLYAVNKHRYYAVATICEGTAAAMLGITLARHYGVTGVAIGTMVPMLIVKVLVMPIYVSRIANAPLFSYVRPMLQPLLVSVAITAVARSIFWLAPGLCSHQYLLLTAGLLCVIYCLANWAVLYGERRGRFLNTLKAFGSLVRSTAGPGITTPPFLAPPAVPSLPGIRVNLRAVSIRFKRFCALGLHTLAFPVWLATAAYSRIRKRGSRDVLLCCNDPLMADYLRPFWKLFEDDPRLRFKVLVDLLPTPPASPERIRHIDEQLPIEKAPRLWARSRAWDLVVCADHCFARARRRSPTIYIGHGRHCKKYPHDDFEYTYGRGAVELGRVAYRRIFAPSAEDRDAIVRAKPDFEGVAVVVGNLENDRLRQESKRREEFRKQLGYSRHDRVVFIVSTFGPYCLWQTMGDAILKAALELSGKFKFALSAHPHEYRPKPPNQRVWGEHLRSQRTHGFAVREPEESWVPYMVAADIVLSDYTGLVEAAILLEKPLVLTPVPAELIWKDSANARVRKFAPILHDPPALHTCLAAAHDPYCLEQLRELAQLIDPHPGQAAKLIADEVYSLLRLPALQAPPRKCPYPGVGQLVAEARQEPANIG